MYFSSNRKAIIKITHFSYDNWAGQLSNVPTWFQLPGVLEHCWVDPLNSKKRFWGNPSWFSCAFIIFLCSTLIRDVESEKVFQIKENSIILTMNRAGGCMLIIIINGSINMQLKYVKFLILQTFFFLFLGSTFFLLIIYGIRFVPVFRNSAICRGIIEDFTQFFLFCGIFELFRYPSYANIHCRNTRTSHSKFYRENKTKITRVMANNCYTTFHW